MDPTPTLDAALTRHAPGFLGAVAALLWVRDTWPRRVVYTLAGMAASYYGAPPAAAFAQSPEGLVGFFMGLFSMAVAAKVFELIEAVKPKAIVAALLAALVVRGARGQRRKPSVFLSYRTSDGATTATALARDLARAFGDDAVFLDKDDLYGGRSWRGEIGKALRARPVLLVLMTREMFDEQRIANDDDPVRREIERTIKAGGDILPVACDSFDASRVSFRTLREPFPLLRDLTWRKLRDYDWQGDVERIVRDIKALTGGSE
jgi:hypothetical protein